MILLSEHQSRREVGACHICAKCRVSQWTPDILGCSMHASAPGKGPAQNLVQYVQWLLGRMSTTSPAADTLCVYLDANNAWSQADSNDPNDPNAIGFVKSQQFLFAMCPQAGVYRPTAAEITTISGSQVSWHSWGCLDRRRILNHIDECPWFAGLQVVDRKKLWRDIYSTDSTVSL